MTLLERRRMMLMDSTPAGPVNLVSNFTPETVTLGYSQYKTYTLSEAIVYHHTYRVVLDATVTDSNTRPVVYIGNTNYGGMNFNYGQNGSVTKTKTLSGNTTYQAKVWVYCRPSSNDGKSHTMEIRDLKIYDITT